MLQSERTFALEGGLSGSLAIGVAMALAVEGVALHVWIAARSHVWAWAITAINVATLVWLWRAYQARSRSALAIGATDVEVTVGNQLRSRFARSSIASAEVATWRSVPDVAPDFINAAKPLEPNVMLVLRDPAEARLPFGIRKRVTRFGLRVGDPDALLAELRS